MFRSFTHCVSGLVLIAWSLVCSADPTLIAKLHEAERAHGLPVNSLVALSSNESSLKWFAINFDDGASFYPKSKSHAIRIIKNVVKRPWVIKVKKPDEDSEVYFFSTRQLAMQAAQKIKRSDAYDLIPQPDGSNVRKLNLLNTGLCAMQLNFRWQAYEQGRSVDQLLDRDFCIEHGSAFVANLIKKHGFEKGIGCYYTCGNSERARRLRKEYFERYNRHLQRLSRSSQLAQR